MIKPINRNVKSRELILPAPIGGLNAKDSIADMKPLYALQMDNYMPTDKGVQLRPGYTKHASFDTVIGMVRTLVSYPKPEYERMIAIYGTEAWNVTTATARKYNGVTFTTSACQTICYKDRLYFVNGADTPKVFYIDDEGDEHFENWGFTHDTLISTRIISAGLSKEFLWFIEKNTLKAYYPTVAGSVQGTLNVFDLSQVVKRGGHLVAVANWTIDGGQGIDDLTVFLTSEGEALVYSGSNPNSADDWSLKGSYKLSRPIGYNCIMPYQGDIVIISEDGYIPLSKSLSISNSGQSAIAFSDTIRGLVLERTAEYRNKGGWESVIYSKKGYAIFNVPVSAQFEQHVINVNTGAWCRFTGIRAYTWCVFQGNLYFGSDDCVYRFDNGYSDNGTVIEGIVCQAYNNLGSPALKKVQLLNPRTKSSVKYRLTIYPNVDFAERKVNYATNIGLLGGSLWNQSYWSNTSISVDVGYKWQTQAATKINSQWIASAATGYNISIVFKTRTKGTLIEWYNTGVRYETGTGII